MRECMVIKCFMDWAPEDFFQARHTFREWNLALKTMVSWPQSKVEAWLMQYRIALASGIISQCRILGGCIGLTLFTVVLNEVFSGQLEKVLQPGELQQLRQSLNTIVSLSRSKQAAVESAFAEAFVQQFRMAAYVAALSIIVSFACWTKHPVALKKRLEVAEKISQGEISLEEGDRLVRGC